MAKEVYVLEVQVIFGATVPLEISEELPLSERHEYAKTALNNLYAHLVDEEHTDTLAFSIVKGLAVAAPLETRLANLYLENAFAGSVEMHGGTYVLHTYRVHGEPDFALTIPVQEKPTIEEEKAIGWRLAVGVIQQQAKSEQINKDLREMFTAGM